MEPPLYRRLPPLAGEIDVEGYVRSLELSHRSAPRTPRPYTIVNFVASVDGRATVEGQSRPLSDPGDRELFRALRERADAVLVGSTTLATERYRRMLVHAERRERRVAAGRPPEPMVVTISRSGRLPWAIPLFAQPDARVVVFSPEPLQTRGLAAAVSAHAATELEGALSILAEEHGVGVLLCEGGPTLFAALVRERLVDELFLTVAPRLVGGALDPAVASGPPPEAPVDLEFVGGLEREGSLLLRYRFSRPQL